MVLYIDRNQIKKYKKLFQNSQGVILILIDWLKFFKFALIISF